MTRVRLAETTNGGYRPGRPLFVRAIWLIVEWALLANPLVTSYGLKRTVLRLFGAQVGTGVIIKPNVKVKYPWRLSIGDHSWIGEQAWIDNMENVRIGANSVLSQGAYVCTGNHDWSDPRMPLAPRPTVIEDGVWIAAFARVGPGIRIGEESIVALGAVVSADTEPRGIYVGNPAQRVGWRTFHDEPAALAEVSA